MQRKAQRAKGARPIPPRLAAAGDVSAVELADMFLWSAANAGGSLSIEPDGEGHAVHADDGKQSELVGRLSSDLGDAVVARLAAIGVHELGSAREQLGRARIKVGGEEVVVYVALRETPLGLSGEVVRIGDTAKAALSPHGDIKRFGIYRVIRELGRGGMGVVYLGEHEALRKPVAIKVIAEQHAEDKTVAARFVLEARAASRVRHPSIVDVTDFGSLEDGRPFLVMEYIEGKTLFEVQDAEGAIDPARALRWCIQIAGALEAVHDKGIVHRDLKPENVFLDAAGRVKVGDFGAVKVSDVGPKSDEPRALEEVVATQAGLVVGTPEYMAPEHARGLAVDHRIDVYALGCMLFEFISGSLPFSGATALDMMMHHIMQPVPKLESPFGELPPIIEAIVQKALAKEADDRYQSIGEMRADLQRALIAVRQASAGVARRDA